MQRRSKPISLNTQRLSAWRVLSLFDSTGLTDDILVAMAGNSAIRARRWLARNGYLRRGPIRSLPGGKRSVCWRRAVR